MATQLTIVSREDQVSLELRPLDRDHFVAELRGRGLEATARVSSYLSGGIGAFFADLAAHWRGWTGQRGWSSLEGELTLQAESDRAGHVFLRARLREGVPGRWEASADLVLEAGQLERLAAAARRFEASVVGAV